MSQTDRATEATDDPGDDAGDGFWDFGIITTLVTVGLALILFPEPATTVTGFLLVAIGVSLAVLNAVA